VRSAVVLSSLLAACGPLGPAFDPDGGEDALWASRQQIIDAAERCGVPNYEPERAGAQYSAYVPKSVPDHQRKEDCIYRDLREKQGLQVTR